ncbi:hypothetical protein [Aurantiacibacter suaedae]|uniref:hypothetical protein n=1 Tax=Aurantiacibacter suaedae TaxID=2545755 RepID=UPI0010F5198E|nr:hypothetical protein [Aurantiacibacter suaedae]
MLVLVVACGPPEVDGQVLANVDGEAITQAELNHEFDLGNRTDAAEGRAAANDALEQLVDRKLLAQMALERGLDRDPDFHFAERRAREELLVDTLRRSLSEKLGTVSDAEIEQFMANNGHLLGQRRLLTLRSPDNDRTLVVDTARLEHKPDWLETVAPGRDLMLEGRKWTVLAVDRINSSRQTQRNFARQLLVKEKVEAELERSLREMRQDGAIRYQQGWGPSARGSLSISNQTP